MIAEMTKKCFKCTENIPICVCILKSEAILYINENFIKTLQYDEKDEIVDHSILRFVHDEDKFNFHKQLRGFIKEARNSNRFTCRFLSKKRKEIWMEVSCSIIQFEDNDGIIVYAYNITDTIEVKNQYNEISQIMQEQEDQLVHSTRLAELGEMAAAVAHELNQPLTGIRNFSKNAIYMIDNNAGDIKEIQNNLKLITNQVDKAAGIINQMRELARKSSKEFNLIDLNQIIKESIGFLNSQFNLVGIELITSFEENLPYIKADYIKIEQVFLNVLTNAKQAMENSKSKKLYIKTYRSTIAPEYIVAEIEDTGIGFNNNDVGNLFKPFYSTKPPGKGTGLGLSISLRILKDHKGNIEATGEPNKGAKFTIRIPISEKN